MFGYDSLKNDKQRKLYSYLGNKIGTHDVENVFEGQDIEDIQAVLGTYVKINDDDNLITFLMFALVANRIKIAEAILENANNDTLKKLLKEESMMSYDDGSLKPNIALSYAIEQQEKFGERFVTMIEDKMKNVCPEVLARYSQQPVGASGTASPAAQATPGVPTQQSEQGQAQEWGKMFGYDSLKNDNQRKLYNVLKSAIEVGSYSYDMFGDIRNSDFDAVLGAKIIAADGCTHNFLTYAIKHDYYLAALGILNTATSLKNLFEDKPMVEKHKGKDNCDVPCHLTALDYARALKKENFVNLIERKANEAGIEVPDYKGQQPVGRGAAPSPAAQATPGVPTQQSGQGQAQGVGSVLTLDKLMENFYKLTPKQKSLHKRLSDAVYSRGNVDEILKNIKEDKDKKDILITSASYRVRDSSIPKKISVTRNLLAFAIYYENFLATKEILQECKRLGILEQVLTTQFIHVVDGCQERSLYALHYAILCSNIELCTEVLDAASNEPDLLKKIFDLTLIYTNADRTETYTPLELAQANRNTEAINIINRKMEENGLADSNQHSQQPVSIGGAEPILPSQSGQSQAQGVGKMLTYGSLKNDDQRNLHDALRLAINNGSAVDNVFNGKTKKDIEDIQAVLGTYVEMNDGAFITFLMCVLEQNKISIAEAILENADKDTLKKLLKEESMMSYYDGSMKPHIAFSYAIEQQEKFGERFVTMIEDKMENVCPEVLARYSQPLADANGAPSPAAQTAPGVLAPAQNNLYYDLKDAIEKGDGVTSILQGQGEQDIKKAFVPTSRLQESPLYIAAAQRNKRAVEELLDAAGKAGILKNVLTHRTGYANEPLFFCVINSVDTRDNEQIVKLIEQKANKLGLITQDHESQPHVPEIQAASGDVRDPQQKIFDELCNLVLQINDAKGAEQVQLIDKFSQKLEEALNGKFSVFEKFKTDDFIKSTAVRFVTDKSNNQQCIETFLNKILSNIPNNENNRKHISDSVTFSLNIEAVKAWSNIMREKNVIEGIDKLAFDVSKHLITEVKRMEPQKIGNFETLGKIKAILEFFLSEQNVKEQTKSLIQGYLNTTEEKMKKEKPFSLEAKQAQFSSPPFVSAPASPAANPILPPKVSEHGQPNQPHVVAGNPASSAAGATSGQSSLSPKVTKQGQPIQPHVVAGNPASSAAGATSGESPLLPQANQVQSNLTPVFVPASPAADATSGQSSLLPQANQVQSNLTPVFVPASLEADATPGQSPLSPGSAQNQLTGTDSSSPDDTSALPDDLGDQSTKTPTFWSENRGKITFTLGVIGSVIAGCAFIAGLPYEAACAIAVIGVVITAIAIGILGKMAYEAVSEQAKTDNTSKLEDTGTMLSGIPPCINLQEESRKR